MKILLILLIIALMPIAAGAYDTGENIALLLSLAVIDYGQSVNMFYNDGSYVELNSLLGEKPSRNDMMAFGVLGVGLTWLLADVLPKPWNRILVDSVVASERFNIEENRRAYSGWNTEGPPLRGRELNSIPIVLSLRF
ncbi:MAG: hypothetical protein A2X56_13745 [Nitrospirae bacterium GWC2_57_13]|jgi:hypothetical protein|nr:MAG: hypothetical protein A2X56_13745 [Nitrospirae bacterium GWC2_57_13]OGW41277.1 MAG: hypothetical protein A2X57_08540 [Nitrospirae bacterium GWD2_57_8]